MPAAMSTFSEIRLVNGSMGDPVLLLDYPGRNDALLFDCGDLSRLSRTRLADLQALFLTHHHLDHFAGFDAILRANLDLDKTLHVFGPEHSIARIHQRITSYELQFLPFMKGSFCIHEIVEGEIRESLLSCAERFPEPKISLTPWREGTVYECGAWHIEATLVEHTAPCLAYAYVEKPGYHPAMERLREAHLRPGPWLTDVQGLLNQETPEDTLVSIDGGSFTLRTLRDSFFAYSKGSRVVFVTDTLWNDVTKPKLKKLAFRANTLFCDSYYSLSEVKQALRYKHMTATHAAELARDAKVNELTLMHFSPRYAKCPEKLLEEAKAVFENTRYVTTEIGQGADKI